MERGTMKNRMDEIVCLLPIIERVARDVHFTHGIEEDEAYGLLALEAVMYSKNYLILFNEGQTGLIELRLKNVAREYARAQRIIKGAEKDQYFYDPEYVRLFLPFFFGYEDWANGPTPDDVASEWITGEALDTALDIKTAWVLLRDWQTRVIEERHLGRPADDGAVDWDGIATAIGRKNAASAREGYASATRELAVQMNTVRTNRVAAHEGPGARKAISNARASALISLG